MDRRITYFYVYSMAIIAIIISIYYLSQPFILNLDKLALILLGCAISYFFVENKEHRRFSVESVTILIIILFSNIQAIIIAAIFMSLSTIFGRGQDVNGWRGFINLNNIFMVSKIVVLGYMMSHFSEFLDVRLDDYGSIAEMSTLFLTYLALNELLTLLYKYATDVPLTSDILGTVYFVFFTNIAAIFTSFLYFDRGLLLVVIVYIFLIPFHQMTNIYSLYRSHEEQVMRDELTGLYNIRFFRMKIKEYTDTQTPFSLVMMDLDGFKGVNDLHGHLAGDEALRVFSKKVSSELRKGDLMFRYAGDEFCILVRHKEDVDGLVSRLRNRFEQMCFPFEGNLIPIGSSIGVCSYDGSHLSPEQIIHIADKQLYKDKADRKQKEEA